MFGYEQAREEAPVGCNDPIRWNDGCWQCQEKHDAIGIDVPCKPWYDEKDNRVKTIMRGMPVHKADILVVVYNENYKKEQDVILKETVEFIVQYMVERDMLLQHEIKLLQREIKRLKQSGETNERPTGQDRED